MRTLAVTTVAVAAALLRDSTSRSTSPLEAYGILPAREGLIAVGAASLYLRKLGAGGFPT